MGGQPRSTARTATVAVLALVVSVSCSTDHGSQDAFCRQIRKVPPLASVISGFADDDPTELRTRLDDARTAYTDLRDAAPEDIRDDVDATVDLVDAVIDAVAANGTDPEAVAAEVRSAVKLHPGAATSSTKVAAYAKQRCAVELNPTVPADSGASTTTSTGPGSGTTTTA